MTESRESLKPFERVALELLWFFVRLIALLPHWFRYRVIARIVYLFVYRVFRYRLKVVRMNLKNSFPQKSEAELKEIERGFYTFISEEIVSTISLARAIPEKSTIVSENGEHPYAEFRSERFDGKNIIVCTAHFGLWEYFLFAARDFNRYSVAVYHKLQNPIFEALVRRLRSHENVILLPLAETMRYCIKHSDSIDGMNYSIGLIADQAPPRRSNAPWYNFLNQETQFYDGAEKMALKLGMIVKFAYLERVGRGRYRFQIEELYNGEESVEQGEITQRYITTLERIICKNPDMWLWSHRRWKRKRLK